LNVMSGPRIRLQVWNNSNQVLPLRNHSSIF
jgi:hypothetical protein